MWTRLLPFLAWLPGLHRGMLGREAWVGLNGAILALPQSMAYALIAGLPAEYGLYAAMLPVAIACLWGSVALPGERSHRGDLGAAVQFGGLAGAAGQPAIRPGRAAADLLAGAFQWLLGVLRVGSLVNFVSHSVMLGFTPWRGAADRPRPTALSSRPGREREGAAPGNGWRLLARFAEFDGPSLLVGGFSFALSLLVRRLRPRWPALLLGLLGGATLVWALPGTFASSSPCAGLYRAHCRAGVRWSSIPDRSSTCYLRRWPAACSGWSPAYRSPAPWPRARRTRSMPTRRSAPRACRTCSGLGCRRACRRAPSPAPG